MRSVFFPFISVVLAIGCNNISNDSVAKADSTNKARRDSNASGADHADSSSKEASEFLVKALDGGLLEVDLGNIAKTKGRHESVKKFGQMMIKDHKEANKKIKELASARHVALPSRLSNNNADIMAKLNKAKAKDFDEDYIKKMVDDHKQDIKEFEEAGNKINDREIKQFINSTLPVLRKHLDSCTTIRDDLKNKKSS